MPGSISVTAQTGISEKSDTLSKISPENQKFVSTWRVTSDNFYLTDYSENIQLLPFFRSSNLKAGIALSQVSTPLFNMASAVVESGNRLVFTPSPNNSYSLLIERTGSQTITISSYTPPNTQYTGIPDTCDLLGICKKFFVYTDHTYKIVSISKNLLRLSGLREESILGTGLDNYLSIKSENDAEESNFSILAKAGTTFSEEMCIRFGNMTFNISARFIPFLSPDGSVTGYKLTGVIRSRPDQPVFSATEILSAENFFDSSAEGICILDDDDRITAANQTFRNITGIIEPDLNSIHFTDLVLPRFTKKWYKSRISNKPAIIGINNLSSGKKKLLFVSYRSRTGREYDFDGTILVITEFRSVVKKIKRHHYLFNNLDYNVPFGLALLNYDGTVIRINEFLHRLVGHNSGLLADQHFIDVIHPDDVHLFSDEIEKLNLHKSTSFRIKLRLVRPDGSYKWAEIYSSDVKKKNSSALNHLLIIRDLSEQYELEQTLHQSKNLAEIGRMSAYLSHELKTPLSSIKMNLDLIKRKPEIPSELNPSLKIISKEIDRLNNMLKDILFYSGIREIRPVKFNIRNKIEQMGHLLQAGLSLKNIRFINNSDNCFIRADAQKFQTLLGHLIDNAVEAIGENGEIEVSTEICPVNGISVKIKDSGCGITEPTRIFDPFYTNRNSGTGLGLPIAQSIAELHNWKLTLHSSQPGETIFKLDMGKQNEQNTYCR